MNFLVAAATSATQTNLICPPRKRMRPNLQVDTSSKLHIDTRLSELISSLQPLTPIEDAIIRRAFYAGIAHESSSIAKHDKFVFDTSDSSDGEMSYLDILAQAVDTKRRKHPPLKRQISEETFTIASLLGQMRDLPLSRTSNKKYKRRWAKKSSKTETFNDNNLGNEVKDGDVVRSTPTLSQEQRHAHAHAQSFTTRTCK